MLAALMDKQIVIETKAVSKNSFGAVTETWTALKTIPASKRHLSGDKAFNDGDMSTDTIQWRVRHDPQITMLCRINEAGQIHEIKEIEEVGRRAELLIRTEKNG